MIIRHEEGYVFFSVCMGGIRCSEKFRSRMLCIDCRQYIIIKWTWVDYLTKKHSWALGMWKEL